MQASTACPLQCRALLSISRSSRSQRSVQCKSAADSGKGYGISQSDYSIPAQYSQSNEPYKRAASVQPLANLVKSKVVLPKCVSVCSGVHASAKMRSQSAASVQNLKNDFKFYRVLESAGALMNVWEHLGALHERCYEMMQIRYITSTLFSSARRAKSETAQFSLVSMTSTLSFRSSTLEFRWER